GPAPSNLHSFPTRRSSDLTKTGEASLPVAIDDADGGHYVIRVAGTDRFGNPVVAARDLTISGKKDETKLRLLADRLVYKVGEERSEEHTSELQSPYDLVCR